MTTTGEFLTKAVVKWLNSEFYPDPNHSTIGTLIGSVFFESMEKNPVFDVHNFALHLKPMLQRNQKADWSTHTEDICNKVTRIISFIETLDRRKVPDFISTLAESCGLLQPEILEPPTSLFSWAMLKKVSFNLSGQFDRCTFLTLLLDDKVGWDEVNAVMALMLGFQVNDKKFVQNPDIAPFEWTNMTAPIDFGNVDDHHLESYLLEFMPKNHRHMNGVLAELYGSAGYRMLRKAPSANTMRRILIAKWLYCKGFFSSNFPPTERFYIPAELIVTDDEPEDGRIIDEEDYDESDRFFLSAEEQ